MAGINKHIIIGNLGSDPEIRTTGGGTSVCNISVAVNEYRGSGEERKKFTEWLKVEVWGKQAENLKKFCKKGRQLYISGRGTTERWQDKDGKDRYSYKIKANEIQYLGNGNSNEANEANRDHQD